VAMVKLFKKKNREGTMDKREKTGPDTQVAQATGKRGNRGARAKRARR